MLPHSFSKFTISVGYLDGPILYIRPAFHQGFAAGAAR